MVRPSLFPSFFLAVGAMLVLSGYGDAAARVGATVAQGHTPALAKAISGYGALPLQFEQNLGQTDRRVKFISRSTGSTLFLTSSDAVLSLTRSNSQTAGVGSKDRNALLAHGNGNSVSAVLRMRAVGANPNPLVSPNGQLPGKVNYLLGKDRKKWISNIGTFRQVAYKGIYKGVDLIYYGTSGQLEYDFVVHPGGNPNVIKLAFAGAKSMRVSQDGSLVLGLNGGDVTWRKPLVYQESADGARSPINGTYVLASDGVHFQVSRYDATRSLVIDPMLQYSTFLGGKGQDDARAIAIDTSGDAYVTGYTQSSNFPVSGAPYQATLNGYQNAFVTELNPSGSAVVYTTYIGGNGYDQANGIAIDGSGDAYVTGSTTSSNFPTAGTPYQASLLGAANAFVAELNPTGSQLVYSTYLGGSSYDQSNGIAIDGAGDAYVTGYTDSSNFPTAGSPFQSKSSSPTAFVAELNRSGSQLVYSTYLGGTVYDWAGAIAIDSTGDAYVTGYTWSSNFPTAGTPFQATLKGNENAFVTELNHSGTALIYSTYLGGSAEDYGLGIALDVDNDAFITGGATSYDFPTAGTPFQKLIKGSVNAFVTELNPVGTGLVYSTFVGGSAQDIATGIAVDSSDDAYVSGFTTSTNYPTAGSPYQSALVGKTNAFVTEVNPAGSHLAYSTYLGGSYSDEANAIAVDGAGNAYVVGYTQSPNFPKSGTLAPVQPSLAGSQNAFVAKINTLAPIVYSISPTSGPAAGGTSVTITGGNLLSATKVTFGGVAATSITTNSATSITAVSPPGSPGTVDVQVTTAKGTSGTSSEDQFTYVSLPTVTGISPTAGPVAGGTIVTVTGTQFTTASTVKFGTAAATSVTYVSSTALTAVAPAEAAATVDVTVTTAGGTSATSSADQYTFLPLPTVTYVTPNAGPLAGGTTVTVNGSGFISGATVTFGGTTATNVAVASANTLYCTSPAGTAGTVDIVVTTPGGSSVTSAADQFTYDSIPTVASITPSAGPVSGGTVVTITGTGFTAASNVSFGSIPSQSVTFNSATSITAVAPAGSGTQDVTVTSAGGTSTTSAADEFTYDVAPTVTSVSPSSGPAAGGQTVTINGSGFVSGATTVSFGIASATDVQVTSASTLTCVSPAGDIGTVDVTVTTPGGTSATSVADEYTYNPPPTVTAVSPDLGPTTGGTTATVTGTGFTGASGVLFGGNAATNVAVANSTTLYCTSPAGAAGTVDVQVETGNGTSATSSADQFTYVAAPTVTAVNPNAGPLSGNTTVTLTGAGFTSATAVMFGATPASSFVVNSDTSITAMSPAEAAGRVNITVTAAGGTSATSNANRFTYEAIPTVSGINPVAGPIAGGTTVTITGTGFTRASTVYFGSIASSDVVYGNATSISAVSPAESAGPVDITVTTDGGTSATSVADQFTYLPIPIVTGINPSAGPLSGGSPVTITGSGFTDATVVDFGTSAASSFTVNNDGSVTATPPTEAAGTVGVTVTTPGGSSTATTSAQEYTFTPLPTVGSVSPNAGPIAGGTTVTVTGTNFVAGATVSFGGVSATNVLYVGPTTLVCTSPAGTGTVDVVVATPGGSSATSANDQFTYDAVPSVTGIAPASGLAVGGTTVTITGTGFTSGSTVSFGLVSAASVTYNTSTSLTAVSPAGTAGSVVDVTVTTPGGTSATSAADQFTYLTPPNVSSISPTAGPLTGNTVVTVTGSGFTGATNVSFGTIAASSFTVVNDTTLTATSPAEAAGAVHITVTTPDGTSSKTAADQFTYEPVPVVSAIAPGAGPLAGGTSVTITGTGFTAATGVTFGSTAATSFTVNSATSITAVSPAESAGTVDITVTTAGGTSGTVAADKFTYEATPTVSLINPTSGPTVGGTTVSITGTGFTAASTVSFGSVAGTSVVYTSPTSISAKSPAESSGIVDVTVTSSGGTSPTSALDKFTFIPVPSVSAVNPTAGPVAGGTSVTITGTNFVTGATVAFGANPATNVVVVNGSTITCTAPSGTAGTVDVLVTTTNGVSTASAADKFTYEAVPTVASISPAAGPLAGNTVVAITGTGFTPTSAVVFGTTAAKSVIYNSATSLTVVSPSEGVGTVNITVTTAGGTSATSAADQFMYMVVPTVASVTPTAGPAAGGNTVTVTGSGFASGAIVTFGSAPATGVIVGSATTLSCVAPLGSGTVNVQVTTPGGTGTDSGAYTYLPAPSVSSISPTSGPTTGGTTITVTGTGFVSGATTVTVGGNAATNVAVANANTLYCTSPAGTSGNASVVVTTSGGASTGSVLFKYIVVPSISAISPAAGPIAGGTSVTITGSGFTGATKVKFGATNAASFVVNTDSSITAVSPSETAGSVYVSVTTAGGTTATTAGALYTFLAIPTVTAIAPTAGPLAGGTSVTITGTGFTSASGVSFGAVRAASVTYTSPTSLTAVSPAGTAGVVDVTVTTLGGTSAVSTADQFTYDPIPTVSLINPSSGPTLGGTTVTITGTGFVPGSTVSFGALGSQNPVVYNSTSISAVSPADSAGIVNITVTTPGGASATSAADKFTYYPLPTVSSITPTAGPTAGGTTVTVTGTNFIAGASVTFGGVSATNVTVTNATTLTCQSPAGSTGAVDVVVTTTNGSSTTSTADRFTYVVLPSVSAISPNSGPIAGGTTVAVNGTGFTAASTVRFGATAGTSVNVVSTTRLTAVSPAGSAGTVDVTVTTAGGTTLTSTADNFTYNAVPTVASVSPVSGPLSGGTRVTITGSGFTPASTVLFGSTAGSYVQYNSPTSISALAPASAAGSVNISVTTTGGTGTSASPLYTYLPVPTVSSVSPSAGPTAGGVTVTVTGTGFVAGATVTFGGVSATNVAVSSGTKLYCTSPAGSAGIVNVNVTTPGGISLDTTGDWFTYKLIPAISSVSPSAGPLTGGTSVVITGSNFSAASAVTFGTVAAKSFTVNSNTSITAVSPAQSAGAVNVAVTTSGGTSPTISADQFSYLPVPTVTALTPTAGPLVGGTTVTISGTGFVSGATVAFGTTPATSVVVVSKTSISCTAPAGSSGSVDVTVTTPGGTSQTSTADKFSYDSAPTVSAIKPTFGPVAGSTPVTITGTGFVAGAVVKFGTVAATGVVVVSATTITCNSPAQAAGTVNVTVTTPGGTSATVATDQYTYNPIPVVTSIKPSAGPTTGGTKVTITGTGFIAGATVKLGTVSASNVVVVSATSITCVTPPESAATVDLTVTTLGGTSAVVPADEFTY
jgi:hypothetical protein